MIWFHRRERLQPGDAPAFCAQPLRHPCPGHRPANWGDNVSIVSALSLSGIVETMHIPGSIEGEAFTLYLDDFLLPKLWLGAVVVMDILGVRSRDEVVRVDRKR